MCRHLSEVFNDATITANPLSNIPDSTGHLVWSGLPGLSLHHLSIRQGHFDGFAIVRSLLCHQGIVLSF